MPELQSNGIFILGSGFGTIISPPIVKYIIAKHSWQGVVLFYASLCLLATVLGLFLVKPPLNEGDKSNNRTTKSQGQELVTLIEDKDVVLRKEEVNDGRSSVTRCLIISNKQNDVHCQNKSSLKLSSQEEEEKERSISNDSPIKETKINSNEKSTFFVVLNKSRASLMEESTKCEKLCGHLKKAVNTTYVIHPLLIMFCSVNLLGGLRCC